MYCRDVYTKRFPELESLVVQPLEYLMTAKELGNQLENVKNNETLQQYLSQVGFSGTQHNILACLFLLVKYFIIFSLWKTYCWQKYDLS